MGRIICSGRSETQVECRIRRVGPVSLLQNFYPMKGYDVMVYKCSLERERGLWGKGGYSVSRTSVDSSTVCSFSSGTACSCSHCESCCIYCSRCISNWVRAEIMRE